MLKQMIIEQADELTCWRVAEYEKSQGAAIRHTILEEYGPATSVSDPTSSLKGASALLHPSEGGTGRAGKWVKVKHQRGPVGGAS